MSRMKSMKIDENDLMKLRYGRYPNMGSCVSSEFYQPCPFFFTREASQLNIVGMYRGASAFLIASGPSFASVDKNLLRRAGIWTMTLNNSVKSFRGNASCIVDDPSRFLSSLWLDPMITKFVPAALFEKPLWDGRVIVNKDKSEEHHWQPLSMRVGDCPNVIGYRRNEKFHAKRYLYEDTINWGNHKEWGGGRSVLLAALRILFLLGFRKVFLLGVDLEMTDDKRYHFSEGRTESAVRGNMSTYHKMMKWFQELRPHFESENFIVKNCNPTSKLDAFEFISLEDAIYEATHHLGDTTRERSEGMYTKYEEKMAAWQQASRGAPINCPPINPSNFQPGPSNSPEDV